MKRNWTSFHRKVHSVGLSIWCCNEKGWKKRNKNTKEVKMMNRKSTHKSKYYHFTRKLNFTLKNQLEMLRRQQRRAGGISLLVSKTFKAVLDLSLQFILVGCFHREKNINENFNKQTNPSRLVKFLFSLEFRFFGVFLNYTDQNFRTGKDSSLL